MAAAAQWQARMRMSMGKERENIYRAHKIGKRQTEKASV